jgi:propanol-preferring alcohol dehydrogenase
MAHPTSMKAMVLERPAAPLRDLEVPVPHAGPTQLLLRVRACGVCRTDLHIVDGELHEPALPLIPGHEIVGEVVEAGESAAGFEPGDRVGVPWLGWTCGECRYCRRGRENLCDRARFTGYTLPGGYAEYVAADARYCFPLPDAYTDVEAAPLLCAGLIGYRTWRLAKESMGRPVERVGLYGFGAAAHIVAQVARAEGAEVYAFTRDGDDDAQAFARRLGATWAGGSTDSAPECLDAALIFAPVGALVPVALAAVDRAGVVVCGGIHMSDVPALPYRLLWEERIVRSVANLERRDGDAFLALGPNVPVHTDTVVYPLKSANVALDDLRNGRLQGAAVLVPESAA